MSLKDEIKNYIPYNEQEKSDKELIIKAMESFDDLLNRENVIAHFTSSAFVINPKKDKVLMVYHNIYDNWSWIGGHCDGDSDFLKVAFKELREETGVSNGNLLGDGIFSIDVLPVKSHVKKGNFISSHLHLSIAYLIEVEEDEKLKIKEDENSGVKWIDLKEIYDYTKAEPHMQILYKKFIEKACI